ncbi:helix-turn-helix domain-containing protein [Listeria ilorinensis]|uniref:helix-turn-helix domain-containing protein n=1 Tax=Listeria ilorinensis TaxID=2867439 RepID=UPI001EF64BF3|nr:Rgg/GadR/MutR family transcriptional regulator [Listeria ilorinensis]
MGNRQQLTIGQTLKQIRTNSNLTQKELYQDIMSVGHRHRVEADEQIPSFDKINQILKRLYVTFDEFIFIMNGYQLDSTTVFLKEFREIKSTVYLDKMENLQKRILDHLAKDYSPFLQNLSWLLESIIYKKKTNDFEGSRAIAYKIWQNLEKKDAWYYGDFILINNLFYIFDFQTIEHIIQRLFDYTELYADFNDAKKMVKYTLYNYATFLKRYGHFQKMEETLNRTLELAHQDHDLLLIIDATYLLAELDWIKGDKEKSLKTAKNAIQSLYFFGMQDIAVDNKEEWLKLTNIEIPLEEN